MIPLNTKDSLLQTQLIETDRNMILATNNSFLNKRQSKSCSPDERNKKLME
jgi:hypothetical protein